MSKIFVVLVYLFFLNSLWCDERRIGKRHDTNWSLYNDLGSNVGNFYPSQNYPDLSVTGALISTNGSLGTATLVAPNYIITAAHVVKNDYDEVPNALEWKFVLHHDIGKATSTEVYHIDELIVHPVWTARQTVSNKLGDGDELGVDLALARLIRSVDDVFPARLPSSEDDPLGERAVLGGFGSLVEGDTGFTITSNDRRVGGENIIDRSVAKVFKSGVPTDQRGGVLGIDFDSPQNEHNSLESGAIIDLLGAGVSNSLPLSLEASTAVGDSGGPAFCFTQGYWRVHGVVSYGTNDSSYGDVTVYTRLASHTEWIQGQLPDWADSKKISNTEWLENPWLGVFVPFSNGWNYHLKLGWLYLSSAKGNSFWAWSYVLGKWIWLSDQAFPFIYCHSAEGSFWMYLLLESSNGSNIRAYDYSSSSWQSYP